MAMRDVRKRDLENAVAKLPLTDFDVRNARNGEAVTTDEAEAWKRAISFLVAQQLEPKTILETHPGRGVGTKLYKLACGGAKFLRLDALHLGVQADLIDVDPFGQPWDALAEIKPFVHSQSTVLVTNGEAYAVARGWRNAQRFPSERKGRQLHKWVTLEFLPRVEDALNLSCVHYFAYPTIVRAMFSNVRIDSSRWAECPRRMWWLKNYD